MLVFGDDNGFCSLYDMTGKEYDKWEERLNNCDDEEQEDILLTELHEKEIKVNEFDEVGYVPAYVVQLGKKYGFDVRSN
jgi:hypothetical protein